MIWFYAALVLGAMAFAGVGLAIAVGALAALAWFVIRYANALLPMANALKALDQTNNYVDERIKDIISRMRPKVQEAVDMRRQAKTVLDDETEAEREVRRRLDLVMNTASGGIAFGQQPDMEG